MIYCGNSPWLDRSRKLSSLFDPFLSPIAENIARGAGKRRKQDAVENIKTALSVIFFNLIRSCALDPSHGVLIDLSNDGYPKGPFNPHELGIRAIRKVVIYLTRSNPRLVDKRGGNFNKEWRVGYATELKASDSLIELILKVINEIIVINNDKPITRNTFDINTYIEISDNAFSKAKLPTIRLREGSSKDRSWFIEFEHTDETRSMESRLDRYNSFISSNACLNLFVSDKEMASLVDQGNPDYDEFDEPNSVSSPIDLGSGKGLHRVFNYKRFDHGGRFYGAWWQNVRKKYRRFITINGTPTVEIDFSSMQLAMLYAKVGQQLEGDAYVIDGFGPEVRDLVKTATLQLINAPGRIEAPRKKALPEGVSWKDLQEAIRAKHKPIAEFFRSGEGIRLQRLDSDIAEDVIMRMMDKGIPVLPIHDSFIVAEGHADELSATMLDAYQQRMGGMTISLKRSPSLFDDLLADQGELSVSERHSVGMRLFLAKKEAAEYEGYHVREKLLGQGEDTEIRSVDQISHMLGDRFSMAGPRAATPYSCRRRFPKSAKHPWDHSVGRGRAI